MPPKLPKLEHVALNSAYETGTKMHQNAQICKLNFKNFLEAMSPDPHTGEGLQRPSPDPTASVLRRFAPTALVRGLRSLHRPQPEILDPSWPHPPSENPGYAYAH